MFQVGLPCYLGQGLNSGRPVTSTKRGILFQKHSWHAHVSPMFLTFLYVKHCFQRQFFSFQDANYAYATWHGILTKIRACKQLQKFCEHEQASTHLILRATRAKAKFCEHFQIGRDHWIPLLLCLCNFDLHRFCFFFHELFLQFFMLHRTFLFITVRTTESC